MTPTHSPSSCGGPRPGTRGWRGPLGCWARPRMRGRSLGRWQAWVGAAGWGGGSRGRAGRAAVPRPHPVRCSRCGHHVARRGTWGRRHCDFGSSPLSGSTGRGPSQNWWLCSVLGDKGVPAVEWGLLPGPWAAQACAHGPSSGGHQLSQPPKDGAKGQPPVPLTAGGRILIRMVPTVVLPVAQLGGLHAGLVPATVVPPGAVCLGGWGQG